MAATACAYGYQGTTTRPPLPPARNSKVPDPFLGFDDDDGDAAATLTPPPPPPPPPPPRPPKVFPSFWSRHLGICTEGLGSESSGDIDLSDLSDDVNNNDADFGVVDFGQALPCKRQHRDDGDEERPRARSGRPPFPPPISVIGAGGKPWLYLRPHREDGRLVLREVRIPSQELLQARREDGRFKLQFAQLQPEEEPEDADHHQCQEQEGNE